MKLFTNENINEVINVGKTGNNIQKYANKKDLISGGEKQRLCFARTFLKNLSILLLDEPTSSIDKNSELEMEKSLEQSIIS